MKHFIFLILILTYNVSLGQDNKIYSLNNNVIIPNNIFIESEDVEIDSLKYELNSTINLPAMYNYSLKTDKFSGWDNEPGGYNVIELSNGTNKLIYKDAYGMARLSNSNNLYSKKFNIYCDNGYFMSLPICDSSYALFFIGQHYGTDLPRLIIVVVTDIDIKLVYNKRVSIKEFNPHNCYINIQNEIIEEGPNLNLGQKIYVKDGVLFIHNNL